MSEDKRRSRSFKVKEDIDEKSYGRYTGESPYQAANKALSELIRKRNKDGKGTGGKINFTLIESTKGSKHREHEYVGKRLKLKTPITYETKDGVTVVKKYKNELRKVKKSEKKENK
jgi:hypothetical protein